LPDASTDDRPDAATMSAPWPALRVARARRLPRAPFRVGLRPVGSVALAHRDALRAWPQWVAVQDEGVSLIAAAGERDAALATIHRALRAQGLIRAWRDEPFVLPDPDTGDALATIERAAARFWGTLTYGAHATGWVAGPEGRPGQLWIARRSANKATDPGRFDNLIGGGVPAGQTPRQALIREGFEEAGLTPAQLAGAWPGSVLRLQRDIPEGLQHEWLYAFDVELPPGLEPRNQDGEVAGFTLMSVAQAAELARSDDMTVDAALVTIDFLARHGLLDDPEAARGIAALRVGQP
jgi:8-oxo-dGTP pyrophosphatase MutT (NUDIX family)